MKIIYALFAATTAFALNTSCDVNNLDQDFDYDYEIESEVVIEPTQDSTIIIEGSGDLIPDSFLEQYADQIDEAVVSKIDLTIEILSGSNGGADCKIDKVEYKFNSDSHSGVLQAEVPIPPSPLSVYDGNPLSSKNASISNPVEFVRMLARGGNFKYRIVLNEVQSDSDYRLKLTFLIDGEVRVLFR